MDFGDISTLFQRHCRDNISIVSVLFYLNRSYILILQDGIVIFSSLNIEPMPESISRFTLFNLYIVQHRVLTLTTLIVYGQIFAPSRHNYVGKG